MKFFLAGLFAVMRVGAQPAIAPPQMGFVQDSARSLRPAYGIAGNFILGPSIAEKVVTQAFSGSLGLVKTDASLRAFDSRGKPLAFVDAAAGPAFFGFSSNGARALAYIPAGNMLVEWRGNAFVPLALSLAQLTPESILAIAFPTLSQAAFLVERNGDIWEIQLPLGSSGIASRRALVGVHAPLVSLPSGDLVYANAAGIVIRRADASEVHIAASLPARFSLEQMAHEWVQLTDMNSAARYAIRTTPGREAFYQLPESSR